MPLVKIVASALTLGTAARAAGKGRSPRSAPASARSWPTCCDLRPAERRVLMAAGMGAGIAAIFRAPLAGTMFAAEVLYRSPEFESEVIIPAGIASVVSYCIFGVYSGWEPLFTIPDLTLQQSVAAGAVPALGPVHGLAGHAVHAFVLRHASGCFTGCRSAGIFARPSGRF